MTGEVSSGARTTRRQLDRVNLSNSVWVTVEAYWRPAPQFCRARRRLMISTTAPTPTASAPRTANPIAAAPVLASPLERPCGAGPALLVTAGPVAGVGGPVPAGLVVGLVAGLVDVPVDVL